jgi:hypothetical protein
MRRTGTESRPNEPIAGVGCRDPPCDLFGRRAVWRATRVASDAGAGWPCRPPRSRLIIRFDDRARGTSADTGRGRRPGALPPTRATPWRSSTRRDEPGFIRTPSLASAAIADTGSWSWGRGDGPGRRRPWGGVALDVADLVPASRSIAARVRGSGIPVRATNPNGPRNAARNLRRRPSRARVSPRTEGARVLASPPRRDRRGGRAGGDPPPPGYGVVVVV